jgi:large exoprotein involved in heme utilization and adhesion
MNKTYRLVFDQRTGSFVAVGENAKARGKRAGLALGLGLVLWAALVQGAGAGLPTGAQVVSGNATFNQTATALTVNQSTSKAIVDWNSFSIGAGNRVQFVQPSSTAVALNRVTGADPSQAQLFAGWISMNKRFRTPRQWRRQFGRWS